MFCKQCGTQLDDKALFCKNCGAKTENAQQPVQQAQPVQQPVQQAQPVYQQAVYQQPVQQPVYQQPVQQAQPAYAQQPVYQQPYVQQAAPKKSNGKLIAIILAAVAVVAAIAVALVLLLGGGSGEAGTGTGGSGGESRDTEAGGSINNLDLESAGSANAMIGGLQNIATANGADFEFAFSDGYDEFEISGSVLFDLEAKEFTMDVTANMDGEEFGAYMYDGYMIADDGGDLYAQKVDFDELIDQSMMDMPAEMLEMVEQFNLESMVMDGETIVEMAKEILNQSMSEEELEMVEMMIDFDELANAFDEVFSSINDDSWLEENLDKYSRSDKNGVIEISLEISSFDFVGSFVDMFLPVINFDELGEMAGQSIDEDQVRDMIDMSLEEALSDFDFLIALDVAIEDDVIRDLVAKFEFDGEVIELEAHIENVGNPSIDEEKLADLLESAEIWE